MRVLLVDNYDSFTFNLDQLLRASGATVDVHRNDDPELIELDPRDYAAVVLSPGPGHPGVARDRGVSARFLSGEVPVLGVCLGLQLACHHFGGRVVRLEPPVHGRASRVRHAKAPLFSGIPTPFEAVRYHSLHCELPDAFEPTAWTDDGVVMAARHRVLPIQGVQFHPESAGSEYGDRLIANFLGVAERPSLPRSAEPVRRRAPELRVHRAEIDSDRTPEDLFVALFASDEACFWLDSSDDSPGSLSAIGGSGGPRFERATYRRGNGVRIDGPGGVTHLDGTIFDWIEARQQALEQDVPGLRTAFGLGCVGYLAYELKADVDDSSAHDSDLPDAIAVLADRALVFQAGSRTIELLCLAASESEAKGWFDQVSERIRRAERVPSPEVLDALPSAHIPDHDAAAYLDRIAESQREIRRGESYEICLTNQLRVPGAIDDLAVYRVLRRGNPAPHSAFFRAPEVSLLCSSPERFLRIDPTGVVESRPIKGTRPRGRNPAEDAQLAHELYTSTKDRSENLMVVDLVRNDLGRVCRTGSVEVADLYGIESFRTVHQLVSTIRGRLRPETTAVDCVKACFPGGSMTGAPKLRTMEILDRLEGRARGPYSGALGYFSVTGAVDLNIVIRTMVATDDEVRIGVGGAVVDLSDPQAELQESLLKGRALLTALGRCRTLERT